MSKIQLQKYTDTQLAMDWQRGHLLSGEVLLERHQRQLVAYFGDRISNKDGRAIILDLVQVTMIKASGAIARYAYRSSVRAWLRGIAYHVYCDWLDHKQRRECCIDDAADAYDRIDAFVDPQADAEAHEPGPKEALYQAVQALPNVQDRAIIELHYYEKKSYAEIIACLQLRCSNEALRGRVHRIKIALRKSLGTHGSEPMAEHGWAYTRTSLEHELMRLGQLMRGLPRVRITPIDVLVDCRW